MDISGLRPADAKRFWSKVTKTNGCWLWTTGGTRNGYGYMSVAGRKHYAHRLSVLMDGRDLPAGLVVDHICHERLCVRPTHLRVITQKQNQEHRLATSRSSSGYRGVSWHAGTNKWTAHVTHNRRFHHIGLFASREEAADAAAQARLEIFTHSDSDRKEQRDLFI